MSKRTRGRMRAGGHTGRRVAMYLRVATDGQTQARRGVDAQRRTIREACERMGLQLPTLTYTDRGAQPDSLVPPALAQLIGEAAAGRFECLIVARGDRLDRSRYRAWRVLNALLASGLAVYFCHEDVAAGVDSDGKQRLAGEWTSCDLPAREEGRPSKRALFRDARTSHRITAQRWEAR